VNVQFESGNADHPDKQRVERAQMANPSFADDPMTAKRYRILSGISASAQVSVTIAATFCRRRLRIDLVERVSLGVVDVENTGAARRSAA